MNLNEAIRDYRSSISTHGILTRHDQLSLLNVFDAIEKEVDEIKEQLKDIDIQLRRIE